MGGGQYSFGKILGVRWTIQRGRYSGRIQKIFPGVKIPVSPKGKIDKELIEKAESENIPEVHIGYSEKYWSIALDVYGTHRLKYPDGTVEIREGKSSYCTCGQSKNKPFCDQTHQTIQLANGEERLFDHMSNQERMEYVRDIKIEQSKSGSV